jgi:hypothetical protein
MIDDDIIHITQFLDCRNALDVMSLSKRIYYETDKRRSDLKNRKFRSFLPGMLSSFLHNVEILDLGQRVGSTDYIDFIRPKQMQSDIMMGRDVHRRAFISIKHENGVITFFQRYTDNLIYYTTGGQYPTGVEGWGAIALVGDDRCYDAIQSDSRFTYLLKRLAAL